MANARVALLSQALLLTSVFQLVSFSISPDASCVWILHNAFLSIFIFEILA
jgi:hypothetical protein